ncbi:hypothetical protein N9850_05905, partial [Granulosicoccus sp.]
MSSSDTAITRFSKYISRVRRRESTRFVFRFAAVLLFALILITGLGAWSGLVRGFTQELTGGTRIILLVVALLVVLLLLWKPLRSLNRDKGASLIEGSDAAFDGRVYTFLDTRSRNTEQPFLSLLARDGLSVARRVPMRRIVSTSAIMLPLLLIAAMIAGFFAFKQFAPLPMRNAAMHIWWGWQDPTLIELRAIKVSPGDIELIAGEDLDIEIDLEGFSRDEVTLHARSIDQEWQTTRIAISPDDQFRFTLFRVKEAMEYYVTAAYSQSDTHAVSVIQPARLERIDAQHEYPEWTRREPLLREDVGDVSGVKNTRIELLFVLDRELQDGTLRLGEKLLELELLSQTENASTSEYRAKFMVANDTQYQLFDRMLDRLVPISAEHAVIVRGDEAPEVTWIKPGRDVTASPIEEITIQVEATDDFAIESINLMYSVNAGEWQSVSLPIDEVAEYVFYLEAMGDPDENAQLGTDASESLKVPDALASVPLQPGDLISYYVRVSDHDSYAETDMMLVDVRPFERRFSEGQGAAGGGGGGGSANEGREISRRQKEILLATWNLQRSEEAAGGTLLGQEDNARFLAELQVTLAEQARTLADRSEARDLVQQGEKIRQFVNYLREAAEQMGPSATALSELAFSDAIQPQQKALQLLQRAEALFADIRMTQQEGQGGGGQQAGQDMAEMFDLEMDLERNQYEQPDRGGSSAGGGQELDDIFNQLEELARRQEILAEAAQQRNQLTREEKWQQQQLSRELEELQRDLEELQEQAANAEGAEASALEETASALSEQIQRARDALDAAAVDAAAVDAAQTELAEDAGTQDQQAGTESGSASQDSESTGEDAQITEQQANNEAESNGERESLQTANEALQNALSELGDARSEQLLTRLEKALEDSNVILGQQRTLEGELRESVALARRSIESGIRAPEIPFELMLALSDRKRQLRLDLDRVRNDVDQIVERFGAQAPLTRTALVEAMERLDKSRVADLLDSAADSLGFGSIAVVLPGESLVTNAIREWRDRLSDAIETAADEELRNRNFDDLQVA